MQIEMINGPDHHLEGVCEGVHPCAHVSYHFLTTAHHTEHSASERVPQFVALGFLWQVMPDRNHVAQHLLRCVRGHTRLARIAQQLQHWSPQTKADATRRLTPRACFWLWVWCAAEAILVGKAAEHTDPSVKFAHRQRANGGGSTRSSSGTSGGGMSSIDHSASRTGEKSCWTSQCVVQISVL